MVYIVGWYLRFVWGVWLYSVGICRSLGWGLCLGVLFGFGVGVLWLVCCMELFLVLGCILRCFVLGFGFCMLVLVWFCLLWGGMGGVDGFWAGWCGRVRSGVGGVCRGFGVGFVFFLGVCVVSLDGGVC